MRKLVRSILLSWVALLTLPLVFISCEDLFGEWDKPVQQTPHEEPAVPVTSITLNKTNATLTIGGDNEALTVTVSPANATDKSVTWSSDKEVVASVDKNGVVTALTLGTATITATANDGSGAKATFTVTVYGHPADVEVLNAATYNVLNALGGGESGGILNNPYYWWEIMSDNCYGSGGLQDKVAKSLHHLTMVDANQCEQDFLLLYEGISRANNQIETIDHVSWSDSQASLRKQLLGEAYFMRGFYTLLLTQMFGDVPLVTSTVITDEMQQQVSAEDYIYPQIIADFVSAKNLMDVASGYGVIGDGHANKYAAEAFLARAYMFWAGFYKNAGELATGAAPAINLVDRNDAAIAQEGCNVVSVSQADVVNYLKDIVNSGVYHLCNDFRSLWQYSNSLLWKDSGHKYAFIADMLAGNCFDKYNNTEVIFQIQFKNSFSWNIPIGFYHQQRLYSNNLSVYWGLHKGASNKNGQRNNTYPFNQGLGQGTPSCNLWDDWSGAEHDGGYTDRRKKSSMIDLDNELLWYIYEKDDCEESGYAVKKYAGVNLDACAADNDTWWSQLDGFTANPLIEGKNFEDFYLMRYPDVLLMLTELTGDAQYMNEVQRRAGVPERPYSLQNVQNERRWEFAFEGLRFNDMRRWSGKNANETSYAANALQAQSCKMIVCRGDKTHKISMQHMTSSWSKRYVDTKGFLPKPQAQITLMNGKLEQNPGWEASNTDAQYRDLY